VSGKKRRKVTMSSRTWLAGVVGSSLVAAMLLSATAGAENGSTPPEPRITFHKSAEGVRGVKLLLYLKTEPSRVWEAVTNPAKAAALFKNVSSITQSSKGPMLRDYHLNSPLGEKVVTCAITQDDQRLRVRWQRVEGHLVELYGYYNISQDNQYPGYTRVDYGSYIEPGGIGSVMMTNGGRRRAVLFMISELRRMTE
jgi:hypothetical protein